MNTENVAFKYLFSEWIAIVVMQPVSGRITDVYLFVKYFYLFPESTQQTGRQKWAYTQDLSRKDFVCLCTAQSLPSHTWLDMLTPYANSKTMQCQHLETSPVLSWEQTWGCTESCPSLAPKPVGWQEEAEGNAPCLWCCLLAAVASFSHT